MLTSLGHLAKNGQRSCLCFQITTGPTSFAPVIEMAMTLVEQSGGQYHVLLIIADGQVTLSIQNSIV